MRPRSRTRSVDEGLVDELFELGADRVGARREQLRHEQRGDLLLGIDPERGAGCTTPRELAVGRQHLVVDRALHDGEPETEADTGEGRLREQRTAELLEVLT